MQRTNTWPLFIFGLLLATFGLLLAFVGVEEVRKSSCSWTGIMSVSMLSTDCPFPVLIRASAGHRSRNLTTSLGLGARTPCPPGPEGREQTGWRASVE